MMILDKLDMLFNANAIDESDEELSTILQELVGNEYNNRAEEEFKSLKAKTEELFEENGIDIDLSDLSEKDGERAFFERLRSSTSEEIFEKLFDQIRGEAPPEMKSKRQLELEEQASALAALQKKGINSIYKQLAKLFHPDLEPDPLRKKEKEALMKTLTNAYNDADLHTLLSLEITWLGQSSDHIKTRSDDQIKMYNSVLQEQIKTIQQEMEEASMHPKYYTIHRFTCFGTSQVMECMEETLTAIQKDIKMHLRTVKQLQSSKAAELIRNTIRSYSH